jgi:hypothetical protein
MREDRDRAPEQAAIQLESIVEMVERLRHARECTVSNCTAGSKVGDAQEYHDEEAARDCIIDSPLSVEVRTDWHTVGAVDACKPTDYKILLCWGGPAVQIVGALDEHNQPDSAELQHQDWFTEWTPFPVRAEMEAALIAYASEFYFDQ